MDFSLLNNHTVIDILIGDVKVYDTYSLPYMSGPNLCELSTSFGLKKSYTWKGANESRWMYMQSLLEHLNKQGRIPELLSWLFDMSRFDNLVNIGDAEKVKSTYKNIIDGAIGHINSKLMLSRKELRIVGGSFRISGIDDEPIIEVPKVKVVSRQYIRELLDRIKGDIENKDYDSVITKSRTLLEEVFIFIIEKLTKEKYKSNGDLVKIYQEVTDLLNMRQNGEWDKRVNELLGGLHKILGAVSSMRNMNSDAHGAGASRITIQEREAILVANSSMMMAEYVLSVYSQKYDK